MFPAELKDELVEGAVMISTVLVLTRLLLTELLHVLECCKECKRRVVGRR